MILTFDVPDDMVEKIVKDIETAVEDYKKRQVWPQKGDKYWYIRFDNTIDCTVWENLIEEFQMLEIGNAFRTQEEAEFKTEQLKVMHELEQLSDDDQEWDGNHPHYFITYDYETKAIAPSCARWYGYHMFYFKSEESVRAAIDNIGEDRLKKYYFCIS